MSKTVSIIVPIYNAQEHLGECLGNIVHQTLADTEVILVNDASTDGSLQIMEECRRQYPEQVKIIDSRRNLGAGGARNLGIQAAQGSYIGFVDSDDLIEPTMYEELYNTAVTGGYDVVDCGYYKQADDLAMLHTTDAMTQKLDAAGRRELIAGGGYIVSKLFKRALFTDDNLRFRTNVILEDADFLLYLYGSIKSIGNVKKILYYYRNYPDSSSHAVNAERYYTNIIQAMTAIADKLQLLPEQEALRPAVEYELLRMYSYGINICLRAQKSEGKENTRKRLRELQELKKKIVYGNYSNSYVQNKISSMDIDIMNRNDIDPERLMKELLPNE